MTPTNQQSLLPELMSEDELDAVFHGREFRDYNTNEKRDAWARMKPNDRAQLWRMKLEREKNKRRNEKYNGKAFLEVEKMRIAENQRNRDFFKDVVADQMDKQREVDKMGREIDKMGHNHINGLLQAGSKLMEQSFATTEVHEKMIGLSRSTHSFTPKRFLGRKDTATYNVPSHFEQVDSSDGEEQSHGSQPVVVMSGWKANKDPFLADDIPAPNDREGRRFFVDGEQATDEYIDILVSENKKFKQEIEMLKLQIAAQGNCGIDASSHRSIGDSQSSSKKMKFSYD